MTRVFLLMVFVCLQFLMKAENPSLNYIEQYKEIAITEMQRTGIPASIKMAQALLESGAGKSSLARKANNHFGIKCGGSWNGESYYREDDDYHKGKLIKSCFRKFKSAKHSFMAHSDFLTKQKRYAFLFHFENSDYKAWAYGLRKAGYATDKAYSKKLISIIEKYDLFQLDQYAIPFEDELIIAESSSVEMNKEPTMADLPEELKDKAVMSKVYRTKRPSFYKNAKFHIVRTGQLLEDIAVLYEIDETALRLRNRLPKDAEPLRGEKINLRKKISLLSRPQFDRLADGAIASLNTDFIF